MAAVCTGSEGSCLCWGPGSLTHGQQPWAGSPGHTTSCIFCCSGSHCLCPKGVCEEIVLGPRHKWSVLLGEFLTLDCIQTLTWCVCVGYATVYVCICQCMYMPAYVYILCVHMREHSDCMHTFVLVCVYTCMHIFVCASVCVLSVYVFMCSLFMCMCPLCMGGYHLYMCVLSLRVCIVYACMCLCACGCVLC